MVQPSCPSPPIGAPGQLVAKLNASPLKARPHLLATEVGAIVGQLLGVTVDVDAPAQRQQGFFDQGMDSLSSIELRNRLQYDLDCSLPTTLAFRYPSINALVDYLLVEVLSMPIGAAVDAVETVVPTSRMTNIDETLEQSVDAMSEAEADAELLAELDALKDLIGGDDE